MQLPCPQCGQMLEAPYPLPAQAKCPFCAAIFTPAQPVAPVPMAYGPPPQAGPPPWPAADVSGRVIPPAVLLIIIGVLWAGWATVNWIGLLRQDPNAVPAPIFGRGNPNWQRGMEIGMKVGRYLGPLLIGMGVVIAVGAIQMLRCRSFGLAIAASIVAMLPCSPCCLLGLPFGIWALVVLNNPEVKSMFH